MRFFGLPDEYSSLEKSRFVLLPVPYEGTVSYGKGTSKGPEAILYASQEVELYDEETDSEPYLQGICSLEPLACDDDPKANAENLYKKVRELLEEDKFVLTIGGEHSITSGEVKAFLEKYPDLTVLQVDAHADLREELDDEPYSHASVMRRVKELGAKIVQVGTRSMSYEEKDIKVIRFSARDLQGDWIGKVISSLGDHVFLTFDLDGLDPSIMPSTGTPEPGGLTWFQATDLLRELCKNKTVVGADFVELAPIESMHAPDFLAARLIYKFIGYTSRPGQ